MPRTIRRLSVVLALVAMLPASMAHAMEIYKFDKMADADQAEYVTLLVDGAQKSLIDEGKDDLAAKIHKLFTTSLSRGAASLGMMEFDRNLDRARVADLQKVVKDSNAPRLEVEHAMIVP
jgi:hypothetical protein